MRDAILEVAREYQRSAAYYQGLAEREFDAGRFTVASLAQNWAAHESRMARELLGIETRI